MRDAHPWALSRDCEKEKSPMSLNQILAKSGQEQVCLPSPTRRMRLEGSNGIVRVTCGEAADLEDPFSFDLWRLFLAYGFWMCLPLLVFLDLPITKRNERTRVRR